MKVIDVPEHVEYVIDDETFGRGVGPNIEIWDWWEIVTDGLLTAIAKKAGCVACVSDPRFSVSMKDVFGSTIDESLQVVFGPEVKSDGFGETDVGNCAVGSGTRSNQPRRLQFYNPISLGPDSYTGRLLPPQGRSDASCVGTLCVIRKKDYDERLTIPNHAEEKTPCSQRSYRRHC